MIFPLCRMFIVFPPLEILVVPLITYFPICSATPLVVYTLQLRRPHQHWWTTEWADIQLQLCVWPGLWLQVSLSHAHTANKRLFLISTQKKQQLKVTVKYTPHARVNFISGTIAYHAVLAYCNTWQYQGNAEKVAALCDRDVSSWVEVSGREFGFYQALHPQESCLSSSMYDEDLSTSSVGLDNCHMCCTDMCRTGPEHQDKQWDSCVRAYVTGLAKFSYSESYVCSYFGWYSHRLSTVEFHDTLCLYLNAWIALAPWTWLWP